MLHYNTITPETLELLTKLQSIPDFAEMRLVGGTSLALQIGHRKSIDIDLFGHIRGDEFSVSEEINTLGKVTQLKKSKNINIYTINGIKVDVVNYSYIWLEDSIIENNLQLAGKKDIAAMKIAAITGRGSKKDFIDLFFLLQEFTLNQILGFYTSKYPDASTFLAIKSLSYFEDADSNEDPVMLYNINWPEIKECIKNEVINYVN
jgi:hypothetical protein